MADELRPEYDLDQLLKGGVRGKYTDRYREGTNLVLSDPDVADAFPTGEAVNKALTFGCPVDESPGHPRENFGKTVTVQADEPDRRTDGERQYLFIRVATSPILLRQIARDIGVTVRELLNQR